MERIFRNLCWRITAASLTFANLLILTDFAKCQQIQADPSLGEESSIVRPGILINGAPATLIQGGAVRGKNLFQSFRLFNVSEGQGVYFDNPSGVERILARVTGNSHSEIMGTLGVYQGGEASLLLINPKGITFGPNASLSLTGSFLATTASSVMFADTEFSARQPSPTAQLSINTPIGLKFRDIPSSIVNQAQMLDPITQDLVGLKVQSAKNLALIGGNIIFEGGVLTASDGRIELASLGQESEVKLDYGSFAGNYDGIRSFNNVQFLNGSKITTDGDGSGNVQVQGKDITFSDGSAISALSLGSGSAGGIKITATGSVLLEGVNSDGFPSFLLAGSVRSGNGGDVAVNANKLTLKDNAVIQTSSTTAILKSGKIIAATGESGNITITVRILEVDSGSKIFATTAGSSKGGNAVINAADATILRNNSGISTSSSGSGIGGNIKITTGVLVGLENSDISADAQTSSGGNVEISAKGIFGFVPRTSAEIQQILGTADLSQFDPKNLLTSDITAISQASPALDGQVILNTPNIDPSKGLVNLPTTVVNPSSLVAQTPCKRGVGSELTRSGRGGLPPSAIQDLSRNATEVGLIPPLTTAAVQKKVAQRKPKPQALTSSISTVVPAQGWVFDPKGNVVLVAAALSADSNRSKPDIAGCPVR